MDKYFKCSELKSILLEKGFYPIFVKSALETIPAADVVEVVHSKWNYDGSCGNCGTYILSSHTKYCANCGAKMDLE